MKFAAIICEGSAAWDGFYEEAYPAVFGDAHDDEWSFFQVRAHGCAAGDASVVARP